MATDVDRLRAGLEAYQESLVRHTGRVSDGFTAVHEAWLALNSEYEGRGAEEFRQRWGATAVWVEEYLQALQRMSAMIAARSAHLRL
jgi:hypothetical protein